MSAGRDPVGVAPFSTVADAWAYFDRRVLQPAPPVALRKVLSDAFYAGAAAMLELLPQAHDGSGEPAAIARAAALGVELETYAAIAYASVPAPPAAPQRPSHARDLRDDTWWYPPRGSER